MHKFTPYCEGLRDGVPIGLGYFAVAFSLGIAAKNAGLTAFSACLASFLNNASAGQFAGFTLMAADASYWEVAMVTLVTNARYLLMSMSLSQRISLRTPLIHRLISGFAVTDELFGIAIARKGAFDPWYHYGAMTAALPGWAVGTALGVLAGNWLPARLVSALSVALFGMFLAVIIPPARQDRVMRGLVAVSIAVSLAAQYIPLTAEMSDGTRTIVLTVVIAAVAAVLFPVKDLEVADDDA